MHIHRPKFRISMHIHSPGYPCLFILRDVHAYSFSAIFMPIHSLRSRISTHIHSPKSGTSVPIHCPKSGILKSDLCRTSTGVNFGAFVFCAECVPAAIDAEGDFEWLLRSLFKPRARPLVGDFLIFVAIVMYNWRQGPLNPRNSTTTRQYTRPCAYRAKLPPPFFRSRARIPGRRAGEARRVCSRKGHAWKCYEVPHFADFGK